MLKLTYSEVWESMQYVMDDELADSEVVDDLIFLFNEFEKRYDYRTVKVAMDALQADEFDEGEKEYEKLQKEFKKMKRETLYEIVSQVAFMAGIAHCEDKLRKPARIRQGFYRQSFHGYANTKCFGDAECGIRRHGL